MLFAGEDNHLTIKKLTILLLLHFVSDSRYLFEGHLTVQPEPAPPAWLVAQNLLTTLTVAQDLASPSERQEENSNATETSRRAEVPESVRELINNMQEMGDFLDLENVIEASMRVCFIIFMLTHSLFEHLADYVCRLFIQSVVAKEH